MTTFYTIIGFAPEPFSSLTLKKSWRDGRVHSLKTLAHAKSRRTRLQNEANDGITYKILLTIIHADGVPSVEWVE